MKRTHKKVLGIFGLVAVAVVTAFAAFIPAPKTQATTSTVTDTIVVRVASPTANVYITSPAEGSTFTGAEQTVTFNYDKTERVKVVLEHTDEEGNVQKFEVETITTPDESGTGSVNIDFSNYDLGYGEYVIKVIGEGVDGVSNSDSILVSYLPVTATVEEDENTGDANVKLDYDDNNDDIKQIVINVYDEDGNLIEELSPIVVNAPEKDVVIPFGDTDLPAGKYIIKVTALDGDGNALYDAYELEFIYTPVDAVPVPNTGALNGGLFAGLNISQTDYLVTGLMVFFIAGALGIYFVAKKNQDKRR